MQAETFFRNKIKRQISWNGQELKFVRHKKNEYNELTSDVEEVKTFKALFHEGGGYGGMLNIELYERDGARSVSRMKPMLLCLYEDAKDIIIDDEVKIGDNIFRVVEKNNIKNWNIAYEISLEKDNGV